MVDEAMGSRTRYLPPDETAMFCEQVALLLKSGIALYDGIEALCNNYAATRYGEKFQRLNETMKRTGSLYESISALNIFPPYMTQMVRVGEQAGTLERVMQGLAAYYTREAQVRATVRSAVTYPLLMVGLMTLVVVVLVVQVLPMFSEVLRNLGGDLSASTTARMDAGLGAGVFVLTMAGLVLLAVIGVALLLRSKKRDQVIRFLLRAFRPLRHVADKLSAGRFASVMAMLMGSGFPLDQAMDLMPGVMTDEGSCAKVENVRARMQEGAAFAEAIEGARIFEPIHGKMIRVGVMAGQTETVMERLAETYQDEVDDGIRRLVSAIEPTLVAIMSIVIGGILLSVMLPLASLMSSLG
jgi:type IV pilus assembly protein PilC